MQQHRYSTRSKNREVNVAETIAETIDFVYLRDDGEQTIPVWKQYEFILGDKYGEPRFDEEGTPVVVIGPSSTELVSKVFLTKPDERGNMKRT